MLVEVVVVAALLAAVTSAAWWRCRSLRRALIRERVAARVGDAAWAADVTALEGHVAALRAQEAERRADEAAQEAVFAEACRIVHTAWAAPRPSDTPRGGTSD